MMKTSGVFTSRHWEIAENRPIFRTEKISCLPRIKNNQLLRQRHKVDRNLHADKNYVAWAPT